jgi:hypothetical protein
VIPLGVLAAATPRAGSYVGDTIALLHFDGSDGATSIVDATGRSWSAAGSAQLNTSWSKFGTAALLLPSGTGHFIEATHADFAFGTGDFCVEFWLRFSNSSNFTIMENRFGGEGSASQVIYDSDGGAAMKLTGFAAGSNRFISSNLATATTYHVAWSRAGGTSRMFLNGTQFGSSYADGNNYTSSKLRFGQNSGNSAAGLDGWIDELRISRVARYTSNFTPPAEAFTLD